MPLVLYAHPFSSYCQKVIIALYERKVPFEWRMMSSEFPEHEAAFARLWPLQHMPLLMDGNRPLRESTVIVEHLDLNHGDAPEMIPESRAEALQVRFMDRVFDNYVMTPMQHIVFDFIRPDTARDPTGVAAARALLDKAYHWLNHSLPSRDWACGPDFTLADCAAAPSLLYADWVHPIPDRLDNLRGYRTRLLTRECVARAVDEARPYRANFPPGAPNRD